MLLLATFRVLKVSSYHCFQIQEIFGEVLLLKTRKTDNLCVAFYFNKGQEVLDSLLVKAGDPPRELTLLGLPVPVKIGIYTELVPADTGRSGEYTEIQLPKLEAGRPPQQVFTNKDIFVFGEPDFAVITDKDSPEEALAKHRENQLLREVAITCRVTIITPALPRRAHPEGKVCGDCTLFSRQRGVEELKAVTHQYQNGSMAMTEEIIKQICDNERKPNLTADIVGHCPINQELCADTSPACESFEAKS